MLQKPSSEIGRRGESNGSGSENPEAEQLWTEYYVSGKSIEARNALVERYMPFVGSIAKKVISRYRKIAEFEDLVAYGVFGLIDAISRFDPQRGIRFATYAYIRIEGAMRDGMRKTDPMPRTMYTIRNLIGIATNALMHEQQRPPTEEELAERTGMTVKEIRALYQHERMFCATSLNQKRGDTFKAGRRHEYVDEILEDHKAEDPTANIRRDEMWQSLLKGFTTREKMILDMYCKKNMLMREIGEQFQLSESNISLILTQCKQRLREKVGATEEI